MFQLQGGCEAIQCFLERDSAWGHDHGPPANGPSHLQRIYHCDLFVDDTKIEKVTPSICTHTHTHTHTQHTHTAHTHTHLLVTDYDQLLPLALLTAILLPDVVSSPPALLALRLELFHHPRANLSVSHLDTMETLGSSCTCSLSHSRHQY